MARLSKNCAQHVVVYRDKSVGIYPQLPHSRWEIRLLTKVIPQLAHRIAVLPTIISPNLPTSKKHTLTDTDRYLYPVSTPPITTTTTYI